jgi:alpha-galactosidase/6-phospho-beta-glucosidase family protein
MSSSATQVTIIGGGSYQWTPELLADLLSTPALAGSHIVLEDTDPDPLPTMRALGERISEALGTKATLGTTTDQRRALDGADFVVVTISTGGFASMTADLEVPARYGVRQSVGDTVGPGGVNRALRNIPVLVGIGRDMEEQCPDAWMLNITNPMTCLTRSVCRETKIKTVGLCHEVGNFCLDVAIALGRPAEAVKPTVAGVNHLPILTSLEIDGEDGFEVIRSGVEECGGLSSLAPEPGRPPAEPFSFLDFARRHFLKLSLFDRWGVLPAAGDRHVAEFLPSILTPESGWGAAWGVALTSIADREAAQEGYVRHVRRMLSGEEQLMTWQSGELPAPVIDSLLTGTSRALPVNVPNRGQCPDLPDQAVVECIGEVDSDRIIPRDRVAVPSAVAELLRRHVAVQELTVEAALQGDRSLVAEAFGLDPLAGRGDLRQQERMVEELLATTESWLPHLAPASGGLPAGSPRSAAALSGAALSGAALSGSSGTSGASGPLGQEP